MAAWRQKKNTINKLKDESGVWVDDMDGMKKIAMDFFMSLYSEDLTTRPDLLLNFVQSRVTKDMNASLVKRVHGQRYHRRNVPNWVSQGSRTRWLPGPFLPKKLERSEGRSYQGCENFLWNWSDGESSE